MPGFAPLGGKPLAGLLVGSGGGGGGGGAGSPTFSFANDLLNLIFNGVTIAGLAQNAASPLIALYVSLHTADPTRAGDQTTNEISYVGYARVAVARTPGAWKVRGNQVSPVTTINFPASSGGPGSVAVYFAIGTAAEGPGEILYVGTINPTIAVGLGTTPALTTASTVTESLP